MYPNYVGSEAVLASENLIFQQHFCDEEAFNAHRHGDQWYIAGINVQKEELKLNLPMLSKGDKVTVYKDSNSREAESEEITIKKPQEMKVSILPEGGAVWRK